jgi:hypothetical protein
LTVDLGTHLHAGGSPVRRLAVSSLLGLMLALAACGDDSDEPTGSDATTADATADEDTEADADGADDVAPGEACDVTDPTVVQAVFGGTVADEEPGAARSCVYRVEGGAAAEVNVFYYGTAAEHEGIKGGYESNRGGVTPVEGIGEDAYSPVDFAENEIVVLAGDTVFAVSVFSAEPVPEVKELAAAIADGLD